MAMKLNKPSAILIGAALLVPSALFGQADQASPQNSTSVPLRHQSRAAGQNQRRRFMDFVRKLNLSPEQQTQFKALMHTQRQQFMVLKRDASLSDLERKQQAQQVQKQVRQQFLAMLTPEQEKQVNAMLQRARREQQNRQAMNADAKPAAGNDGSNTDPDGVAQPSQQQLEEILASFVSDEDAAPQSANALPAAPKTGHAQ